MSYCWVRLKNLLSIILALRFFISIPSLNEEAIQSLFLASLFSNYQI
jgi:hypothetical protein